MPDFFSLRWFLPRRALVPNFDSTTFVLPVTTFSKLWSISVYRERPVGVRPPAGAPNFPLSIYSFARSCARVKLSPGLPFWCFDSLSRLLLNPSPATPPVPPLNAGQLWDILDAVEGPRLPTLTGNPRRPLEEAAEGLGECRLVDAVDPCAGQRVGEGCRIDSRFVRVIPRSPLWLPPAPPRSPGPRAGCRTGAGGEAPMRSAGRRR